MQQNEDRIKDLVKSRLSQFEADPPSGLWLRIEQQVRRRKRLVLFRYAAVAAGILLLAGIPAMMFLTDQFGTSEKSSSIAQRDQSVGIKQTEASVAIKTPELKKEKQQEQFAAISSHQETQGSAYQKLKVDKAANNSAINSDQTVRNNAISNADTGNVKTEEIELITQATLPTNQPDTLAERPVQPDIAGPANVPVPDFGPKQETNSRKSWDLALGYGSNPSVSIAENSMAKDANNASFSPDDFSSGVAAETSYYEQVESTTHRAPLVFGFAVSRNISKRWSLESGLIYSRLSTVIRTTEMNAMYHEYESVLHYLGVPLGVRVDFLKYKSLGMYAMQSVVFEKGLANSSIADTYTKSCLSATDRSSSSVRGIQISSVTAVGLEVDVMKRLGVYGQAGAQMFFLNGSQPYNIRSAHKVWPSFQTGLRFHL